MDQIDLFRLVNPTMLLFSPSPRRTLPGNIALPELDGPGTLPELFLIEEQSVRNRVDVMSETNGSERLLDAHLDLRFCEAMINFDYQRGGRSLFFQPHQTRSMFLQAPKQEDIEHPEDTSCVQSKCNDFYSLW
jgi:hypothetical protein